MKRIIITILFLSFFIGKVFGQSIDQKLSLVYNSKQIGDEFIIGYQIKGTNLGSAKTLASINVDIIYDTTTLRFTEGTNWIPQLSDTGGYIKSIKSNSAESGTKKSVRIIVTAPYLNDSGNSSSSGIDINVQYATIVKIHFIILSDSGYTTISIKNVTNQAGLFLNPHNQPNTFDVSSMTLSDPIIINEPMPVEMTSFSHSVTDNNVKLLWKTGSEINNQGFEIQRSEVKGQTSNDWIKAGYTEGQGTKTTPTNYSYEDKKLNTGKYEYRLKQIDYNGNFKYYELEHIIEIGAPRKYNLSQNYPNPFNPYTKIDYEIPFESKVKISVFDITGRELQTLVNEKKSAGYYNINFDGAKLSSGIYFYRINAVGNGQDYIITKKMMLIK